jgi:hypothetical protein
MGRLPKELQEFKDSLKDKTFKERVKRFFDLSSTLDADIDEKRKIIKGTFSKKEQREWDITYKPIVMALEDYIDRIRTLNVNRQYFSYYITTILRLRDTMEMEAEWFNGNLEAAEALKGTEAGSRLYNRLTAYHNRRFGVVQLYFDEDSGKYILSNDADGKVKEATASLRRILSNLKGYIEALKNFMEWVGEGDLIPKEIRELEKALISTYHPLIDFKYRAIHGIPERRGLNASEPVNLDGTGEGEKDFLFLSYLDLEAEGSLTWKKNLFAGSYEYYKNK